MITSKQAARIRWEIKAKKNVSPKRRAMLDEYNAAHTDQQSPAETSGEGGGDNSATAPKVDPVSSQPADAPPPADLPTDLPGVEPPPAVSPAPIAASSSSSSNKTTWDWRDKWRQQIAWSGDGRQMLCEMVGGSIVEGLGALYDETSKVTSPKTPDPRKMAAIFVLAIDDVLPDRARLTPKIGAALLTVGTIGERYAHAKKIEEYLKTDPDHQAWLKKQAERERTEQELRAKAEAERAAASSPPPADPSKPTRPEAPPPPEPPPVNGTQVIARPAPRTTIPPIDLSSPDAIY